MNDDILYLIASYCSFEDLCNFCRAVGRVHAMCLAYRNSLCSALVETDFPTSCKPAIAHAADTYLGLYLQGFQQYLEHSEQVSFVKCARYIDNVVLFGGLHVLQDWLDSTRLVENILTLTYNRTDAFSYKIRMIKHVFCKLPSYFVKVGWRVGEETLIQAIFSCDKKCVKAIVCKYPSLLHRNVNGKPVLFEIVYKLSHLVTRRKIPLKQRQYILSMVNLFKNRGATDTWHDGKRRWTSRELYYELLHTEQRRTSSP